MQELPEPSIEKLARVTKLLRTQRTLPAKLEAVVAIAKRVTPGCDAAGISLLIEGEPATAAVSDRLTVEVDVVQYQTGEGPCLAALEHSNIIRIDVLGKDERFPRFAPGALAVDVESVLSVPLTTGGQSVGALNLYSRVRDAFDSRTAESLQPIADYAAEVLSTSPLYAYSLEAVDGLVETLESRALISQAVGVIVASEDLRIEEAFDRLRRLALESGESMRAVAEWVLQERPSGPVPAELGELRLRDDRQHPDAPDNIGRT